MTPELRRLSLDWTFSAGRPSDTPDSPPVLRNAVRGILEEGRPQQSLRLLGFRPNLGRAETFWLGAILRSSGDRLVYFLPLEHSGHQMYHGKRLRTSRGFAIDHLTLERDRRGWHLTRAGGRNSAGPQTVPVGHGTYLWFGMSIASPETLRPMISNNHLEFDVPSRDAERRIALLHEVRDNARDLIASLNPGAFKLSPPWYVQVNFVVGPPGFVVQPADVARILVNPAVDPTGGRGVTIDTPAREHRLTVGDDLEVLVATLAVPRKATEPFALMSWA